MAPEPAPHPPSGPRAGGFTLIEVLAALVIVSLGMLGVIQAVSQTATNSAYLRDRTLAHWIAMNRLTEIRLEPAPPAIDETSGDVDYAGRRWYWTTEVTGTPVESMRRIDIRVRLADARDEDAALAVLTGFYGAAIAPPGSSFVSWDGTGTQQAPGDGDTAGDATADDSTIEAEPEPPQ